MIPRILDNTKTLTQLASDTSQGLGRLTDCLSCMVTEKRNGEFTATLKVPANSLHFSDLTLGGILAMQSEPKGSEQWFRIYKISKPLNGIVTVELNHISYDLGKTTVVPFTSQGAPSTLVALKSHMTGGDAFTLYTDIDNTETGFSNDRPQSARALFGGQSGSLLDQFGGEYEWDNLTVKLLAHRGLNNGVRIAYGKNLTDIRQDENIENMYTAVMPYTKREGENAVLGDLQVIIQSVEPKILNLDLTEYFDTDEEITKAKINEKAQAYIDANDLTSPRINLKVSFVNLADTEEYKNIAPLERVRLCDTVTVVFPKLGINATAKVIECNYDVLKERYDSIEIGDAKSSLSTRIMKITQEASEAVSQSFLERAIDAATDLITGGMGGHVVIATNANGEPNEILVMDTDDKATATNVIRINMNGIGFSSNGYSGPYTTAWTIDGGFNADFINSGTIQAINIIGSLIQGSSLIFGDAPNTTELRTNDAKTGALFEGQGVMEFETKGHFIASNYYSNGNVSNSIGMNNQATRSFTYLENRNWDSIVGNYLTLNAYKNSDGTPNYNSISLANRYTSNTTDANYLLMYCYSTGMAYSSLNNKDAVNNLNANSLAMYHYVQHATLGDRNNIILGNSIYGENRYANSIQMNAISAGSHQFSVYNQDSDTHTQNANVLTLVSNYGSGTRNQISMQNYNKANNRLVNSFMMFTQNTWNAFQLINNSADGIRANMFQQSTSATNNTADFQLYNYDILNSTTTTQKQANCWYMYSNDSEHVIRLTNYAKNTANHANEFYMSNSSTANSSTVEISNYDKNGNSLRNRLYMLDDASTQYIRLANYAGNTLRNQLYSYLTGNTSRIGLFANDSSGNVQCSIELSGDGKMYVKAGGQGAWQVGWVNTSVGWVLGYIS